MEQQTSGIDRDFIISFFLPDGMIDWFEVVNMTEENNPGTTIADKLYNRILNIYLDERDNRSEDQMGLKPNGFTEATVIKDYPIRNRKVLLHVRRRRYLDADGRNIILNQYPLNTEGTKVSVEYGLFLKMTMDSLPLTAALLGKLFPIKGSDIEQVELLTRSRNLLSQSGDKWGEHKKERARLLFDLYPQMQEGYSLICKVRDIFKRKLTIDEAKHRLHEWYKDVNICTLREIKAARDCIKSREVEVLNYFINRATNASAESLNSKMKGFRAQLHGIADIPFFMYRICTIFG